MYRSARPTRGGGLLGRLIPRLGCPCDERRLGQLLPSDDGSDSNFGLPTSLVNFSAPTAQYPASPESGAIYTPSGPETPPLPSGYSYPTGGASSSWGSAASSSPVIPVLPSVGSTSQLSAGGSILTPSLAVAQPIAGANTSLLIFGGLGLLAVVVFSMSGKRR